MSLTSYRAAPPRVKGVIRRAEAPAGKYSQVKGRGRILLVDLATTYSSAP